MIMTLLPLGFCGGQSAMPGKGGITLEGDWMSLRLHCSIHTDTGYTATSTMTLFNVFTLRHPLPAFMMERVPDWTPGTRPGEETDFLRELSNSTSSLTPRVHHMPADL